MPSESLDDIINELDDRLSGKTGKKPQTAYRRYAGGYGYASSDVDKSFSSDLPPTPTPHRHPVQPLFKEKEPMFFPAHSSSSAAVRSSSPQSPTAKKIAPTARQLGTSDEPMNGSGEYGDEMWEGKEAIEILAQHDVQSQDNQATDEVLVEDVEEQVNENEIGKSVDENGCLRWNIEAIYEDYRPMFPYKHFNKMQSQLFETVYRTSENLVVSAPTGSGKTTVFELAFLRMVKEWEGHPDKRLAIYIAPTKALCSERANDWAYRLSLIKSEQLTCIPLTGDTTGVYLGRKLENVDLIVTTPEKWDAVTRRGKDSQRLLNRLSLVMIDEVHILCESRGPTLEVVVSRMKSFGRQIRFVAVSASVPNVDDIARWLGAPQELTEEIGFYEGGGKDGPKDDYKPPSAAVQDLPKAKVFKFGDDYRPVPLTKIVRSYDAANEWALGPILDKELFPLLLELQRNEADKGKPVLVFCPTRRACQTTAKYIHHLYDTQVKNRRLTPWDPPRWDPNSVERPKDADIAQWAEYGIAVHHAGLDHGDRQLIENWFREGKLKMLISTSTLAVGVNLPAHTVVVKGTMTWNGPVLGFREYSDIEIQQMMGRAGRPQYDKHGVVVLMCEASKQSKYTDMLHSKTVLESQLHTHLTEHINSEISRGTIKDLRSATEWLRGTFLFVRIQQNPSHYALPGTRDREKTWEEWFDHFAKVALDKLERYELVTHDKGATVEEDELRRGLTVTQFGETMCRNCISFTTMCSLMRIREKWTLRDMIELLCGATEFTDLRARPGETQLLNSLRQHHGIRYQLEEPVKTYCDKVFLLLQVNWGNVDIGNDKDKKMEHTSVIQTQLAIYQSAPRIARAILQVASYREYGIATRSALQLLHLVNGKSWEDDATVFRQLESIGPKSIKVLGANDIKTFAQLRETPPERIGLLLNRQGTFSYDIHKMIDKLPTYDIVIEEEAVSTEEDEYPVVTLKITIICKSEPEKQDAATKAKSKNKKNKQFDQYNLSCLILRSDGKRIIFRTMPASKLNTRTGTFVVEAELEDQTQDVVVYVGVNERAGLFAEATYKNELPSSCFPPKRGKAPHDGDDDEDLVLTGVAVMDNGNYRCSHKCRDRQACQHPCCKEGIKKRPSQKSSIRPNPRPAADFVAEADQKEQNAHTHKAQSAQLVGNAGSRKDTALPQIPSSDKENEVIDLTKQKKKKREDNSLSRINQALIKDSSKEGELIQHSKEPRVISVNGPGKLAKSQSSESRQFEGVSMEVDDEEQDLDMGTARTIRSPLPPGVSETPGTEVEEPEPIRWSTGDFDDIDDFIMQPPSSPPLRETFKPEDKDHLGSNLAPINQTASRIRYPEAYPDTSPLSKRFKPLGYISSPLQQELQDEPVYLTPVQRTHLNGTGGPSRYNESSPGFEIIESQEAPMFRATQNAPAFQSSQTMLPRYPSRSQPAMLSSDPMDLDEEDEIMAIFKDNGMFRG